MLTLRSNAVCAMICNAQQSPRQVYVRPHSSNCGAASKFAYVPCSSRATLPKRQLSANRSGYSWQTRSASTGVHAEPYFTAHRGNSSIAVHDRLQLTISRRGRPATSPGRDQPLFHPIDNNHLAHLGLTPVADSTATNSRAHATLARPDTSRLERR